MKPVNYIKSTLFNSTLAHFQVSVECRIMRRRQTDGSLESLCYIDNKGNAVLNPNIYLVFGYKGDTREEDKMLYMSYPQLFKMRQTLENVKDLLLSDSTFTDETGVLEVRPNENNIYVISDIGKEKKWISFSPAVVTEDETVGSRQRGVTIQISGQNNLVSLLSQDEFLTIYTIVKDLNLAELQSIYSIFALNANDQQQGYNQGYQFQPQQNFYQQNPQYTQQVQGNYQNNYQQNRAPYGQQQRPATPRYGGQQQAPQSSAPKVARQTTSEAPVVLQQQPAHQQPRNTNIINMQAVEEAPVTNINWDDDDSIDEIFNN
jgi:hypothetical protein